MAGNGWRRRDEPHTDIDIAAGQRSKETAQIGSQVDDLYTAGGVPGVHLSKTDEDQHQKCPRAGTVIAVISTDDKRRDPDNRSPDMEIHLTGLVRPAAVAQGNKGHHRQHRQQQIFQDYVWRMMLEPSAATDPINGQ